MREVPSECLLMLIGHHARMTDEASVHVQSFLEDVYCIHTVEPRSSVVSLSSAQSEMYAAASGGCDAVLIVGILKWIFDMFFQIHLYLDSAAVRGILNRRGVGKVRHLSCRCLWLQQRMADGSMIVTPVSGLKNPADIGAKRSNVQRTKALMFLLGMFDHFSNFQVGEAAEARSIVHQEE